MKRDISKLLHDFAADCLTDNGKRTLAEAAIADQEVFDVALQVQILKDLSEHSESLQAPTTADTVTSNVLPGSAHEVGALADLADVEIWAELLDMPVALHLRVKKWMLVDSAQQVPRAVNFPGRVGANPTLKQRDLLTMSVAAWMAVEGKESAFAGVFVVAFPIVRGYLRRYGLEQDADDLAQEIMLVFYKGLSTLEDPSKAPVYLYQTVRDRLNRRLNRRLRRQFAQKHSPSGADAEEPEPALQEKPLSQDDIASRWKGFVKLLDNL